jgi:hypothetical protein
MIVQVGAGLKRHAQAQLAVAAALGGHVEHVLNAVDFLLERGGDGGGHDVGARPRVDRRHIDRGRSHLGILRDRQLEQGEQAEQDDHDRKHRREDRPADKEMGKFHRGLWR